MYKKILVPLDGSKIAEKILPHVESLAGRYQANVFLLTVLDYMFATSIEGAFVEFSKRDYDQKSKAAESYLKGIAGELREKKIPAEIRVAQGKAVSSILEIAASENVDLIAMASHGGGALARVFYGSVASGVLNRVDRALLIIRSRNPQ